MASIGGQRLEMPAIPRGIRLLLAINVAVFVANVFCVGRLSDWLALSWNHVREGYGLGAVRFLTYQFVHSYSAIDHILFNMLGLWVFGGIVEGATSTRRTLWIYLLCGLGGGAVQLLLTPWLGSDRSMVGASGAVFGFVAYAVCVAPNRPFWMFVTVPLWIIAAVWGLMALYNLQLQLVQGVFHGVADAAHVGGALTGFVLWKAHQSTGFATRFRTWRARQAASSRAEAQVALDRVLAKVKAEGLAALSTAERKVLDRASRQLRDDRETRPVR